MSQKFNKKTMSKTTGQGKKKPESKKKVSAFMKPTVFVDKYDPNKKRESTGTHAMVTRAKKKQISNGSDGHKSSEDDDSNTSNCRRYY